MRLRFSRVDAIRAKANEPVNALDAAVQAARRGTTNPVVTDNGTGTVLDYTVI